MQDARKSKDRKQMGYKCPLPHHDPNDTENTPVSVFGHLALNNLYYNFYPIEKIEVIDKKARLATNPIRVSFYDEGAEEETRELVKKYGCGPLKINNSKSKTFLPNIRLICYPSLKEDNKLDVLYGIDIFDNSLLPSNQKGESEVIQTLVKKNLSLKSPSINPSL